MRPPLVRPHLGHFLAFGLLLLLAGCEQLDWLPEGLSELIESTENTVDPPVTQSQAAEPFVPLYLRLPLQDKVETLDPGLISEANSSLEVVEQLFLSLTDFNPETYEVVPDLALEWRINSDGTVYTFYLRQGVSWNDDKPVLAHDVVWAIQRNLAAKTQAPLAHSLFILKNARAFHHQEISDPDQVGVKALDDHTLEFTLEYSSAYLPALVSLPTYSPLPRHAIETYGEAWINPEHIQTNGAYEVSDWQRGELLILRKNSFYYDFANVNIPQIYYFIVPNSQLGLAMYRNNELDLIGGNYLPLPKRVRTLLHQELAFSQQYHSSPNFCTESYVFNTQLEPVNNKLVRKAINAAINQQLIVDFILNSQHEAATTFTRPPTFGAVATEHQDKVGILFNLQQAQAWLVEAGYPEGVGFPPIVIKTLHHEDDQQAIEIANAIKIMLLRHLNIPIEIEKIPYQNQQAYKALLKEAITANEAHLIRLNWCGIYPDAHNWLFRAFHPTKSPNYVRWDNQKFASAVEKAELASDKTDEGERSALYFRAEQILNAQEAVIVPIYFAKDQYLIKPWLKTSKMMAFGGQHLRHWTLQSEQP